MRLGYFCLFLLISSILVNSESQRRYFQWIVAYSRRAPLGVQKQVIVINDQFPGPVLGVTTNDVVEVNVFNRLTEPFLLTWNGVQMRRNSWQDGMQETNCPISPGQNWTYSFETKDQIGSFFYFPSLLLHKSAGGYGPIRVHNLDNVPLPFPKPYQELDIIIGDWYNSDSRDLRASLDGGNSLPQPDGILINGLGPNQANFYFQPGKVYRLRISNVGLKTSLNFRIQDHQMLLVETEGSYTQQQHYSSLDIHVGQSYSVLVTSKNQTNGLSYYMVASSRFSDVEVTGIGIVRYPNSQLNPTGPLPAGPFPYDYQFSLDQANSIRWNLSSPAARPDPQGSYHYGTIEISGTYVLENGYYMDQTNHRLRYTVNGVSFLHPDTPLKLADYFQLADEFSSVVFPHSPVGNRPTMATSVIDANYRDFIHIVFVNPLRQIQTWHVDGYNFFVVGMDVGSWDSSKIDRYNMVDAVSRSTVQVFPESWTAVLMKLDNQGMWNLRSQNAENWYLGQELYIRVKRPGQENPSTIPERDEAPIPFNAIKCGRATRL